MDLEGSLFRIRLNCSKWFYFKRILDEFTLNLLVLGEVKKIVTIIYLTCLAYSI